MYKNKLLSVIIPCFNVEMFISDCFSSICNAIPEKISDAIEIFVINDGSTDDTLRVINEFKWGVLAKCVTVIDKTNGGLSDARNEGLKLANGKYIAFIDSDDIWLSNMQIVLSSLSENDSDIIDFNAVRFNNIGNIDKKTLMFKYLIDSDHENDLSDYKKTVYKHGIWMVWARFFKKNLINDMTFPVGKTYEDIIFTSSAYKQAKSIETVNLVCVGYRLNPSSITAQVKPIDITSMRWVIEQAEKEFMSYNNECAFSLLLNGFLYYKTLMFDKRSNEFLDKDFERKIENSLKSSGFYHSLSFIKKMKIKYLKQIFLIRKFINKK